MVLVSASVTENLVPEKGLGFGFGDFVSEKSFSFGKFGLKKSIGFGFGKLDPAKEKIKITRKKLDQVDSANLLFEF